MVLESACSLLVGAGVLAVGGLARGRSGGRLRGRPGRTWCALGAVRPASRPGDLLTFFGVSFMAVFKVAGPRGYPFKRRENFLKRHGLPAVGGGVAVLLHDDGRLGRAGAGHHPRAHHGRPGRGEGSGPHRRPSCRDGRGQAGRRRGTAGARREPRSPRPLASAAPRSTGTWPLRASKARPRIQHQLGITAGRGVPQL